MSARRPPPACTSMADVRTGVDSVDRALVALLAERMAYMAAAARIKTDRASVRDEARKRQVIGNAMAEAERHGIDPALVARLWEELVEASIAFEYREWDRLRVTAD